MTHKVLLADDSLTIQKVIKITLANEPYILLDCRSEADLMNIIERESPQLVLLDFSLSETHSGYELCKIIRSKKPQTAVLMMYGTFDTVDENALKNCGAKGKIIKPFDSTKFINLCRSLIEEVEGTTQESAVGSKIDEVFSPRPTEELSWKVDAPAPKVVKAEEPIQATKQELESLLNPLESNMQEWGMSIPGKIGQSDLLTINLPPKIEQTTKVVTSLKIEKEEESTLPASADLEYPDMGEIQAKINATPTTQEVEVSAPKSKLVPLTDLAPASSKELSFEESTGSFEITLEDGTTSDEDIRRLEEQISDEISHTVAKNTNTDALKNFADIWAADEIEELNPTMEKNSPKHTHIELEPITNNEKLASHPEMINEVKKDIVDLNLSSELEEKIKQAITPIVEKMVKDYCKQTLEKVAWEVIPDLAENLIKKELQRISDSVIGE